MHAIRQFLRKPRALRTLGFALVFGALAIGGCAELAHKERELVFRVVPGEAS